MWVNCDILASKSIATDWYFSVWASIDYSESGKDSNVGGQTQTTEHIFTYTEMFYISCEMILNKF